MRDTVIVPLMPSANRSRIVPPCVTSFAPIGVNGSAL
jgi:hypothetical protein